MKLFGLKRVSTLAASLVGIFCLLACGQFGPDFMTDRQGEADAVRFADPANPEVDGRVAGSYLVMFREQRAESKLFFSTFREEYGYHYRTLSEKFLSDHRVKDIQILSAIDMSSLRAVEWEPEFSAPKLLSSLFEGASDDSSAGVLTRVDFDSEESAKVLLEQWEGDKKIWFAEPNEASRLSAGELNKWATDYDTFQPWYDEIKLPRAFQTLATGLNDAQNEEAILDSNTLIAVLDSGVDYEHPQLKDNIWENTAIGAAGCANDLHGCNTTAPSKGSLGNGEVWPNQAVGPGVACGNGEPSAECNHGTHVAGIIAAKPSTGSGDDKYGGVCPICKVMILKVAEVEGDDTSADLKIMDDSQIRAFKYLTRFRKSGSSAVRLINASFGKYNRSRSQAILIDVLKRVGTGTLVIAAASNEDSVIRSYPAAFANAIAVASVGTQSDQASVQKSFFSNYGSWVDIAAPGFGIRSSVSGDRSFLQSGTSMAAPVVAGAAGLLLSAFPNLTFNELKERILNSADASKLYGGGKDGEVNVRYYYPKVSGEATRRPLLGGGYVDAEAMLNKGRNSATGQPLERVTAGCATILGEPYSGSSCVILILIGLPLLVGLFRLWGRSWGT